MSSSDRPYIQAWLKRVERQVRGSGRISQIAFALSRKHGGSHDDWDRKLRDILSGEKSPSADLIADIDHLLAKPVEPDIESPDEQGRLL